MKLLPINVVRVFGRGFVFSGGGYFRLCPAPVLENLFARHNYVMTYFHPRDFNSSQPVLPGLSATRRFKSYVGLKTAMNKLERLLKRFEFDDIASAEKRIDWRTAPRFMLVKEILTPVIAR